MARFNAATQSTTKTVNLAGGKAYTVDEKFELASIVLTSFLKDGFYRTGDQTLARIQELARKLDPLFVAKLAVYARNNDGMRSTTHVLAGEVVKRAKGEVWTRPFLRSVFFRPDDMLEVTSYYQTNFGRRPIPNALKRAVADRLRKLDAYQLAKYRGEGKAIKMVDLVNIAHPKGGEHITKLIKGELTTTGKTWEAKLSDAGKAETEEEKKELKADAWKELLAENKLGYLALLRNLRNIVTQSPDALTLACERLRDEKAIRKAKIFPFQFVTAIESLKTSGLPSGPLRQVFDAIFDAIDIAVGNVPRFEGRTLVALDDSGSMGTGPTQPFGIGSIFAAAIFKANDAEFGMFSDAYRRRDFSTREPVMSLVEKMAQYRTGNGTNFHAVFDQATEKFDRIIVLSDHQGWMPSHFLSVQSVPGALAAYKKRTGANPKLYMFDLQGLGTSQFPERDVYMLTGISDRTLGLLQHYEQDPKALITKIEATEFR